MYKEEFEALTRKVIKKMITIDDLVNKFDRTLLYGYTCDMDNWHVYIEDGRIYTIYYVGNGYPIDIDVTRNEQYVPNKRLYPECCDYEFCRLLKEQGIYLPFATWQDRPEKKIYYGKRLIKEYHK